MSILEKFSSFICFLYATRSVRPRAVRSPYLAFSDHVKWKR